MMLWLDRAGRTLVMPPDEAFEDIEYLDQDGDVLWETIHANEKAWRSNTSVLELCDAGTEADAWAVVFSMWTVQDGRSEFSLELTLSLQEDTFMKVELEDLHVM